jgi:hypothetical protein
MTELGDAFRSWCGRAEDDPHNGIDLEFFAAAWKSYLGAAGDFITEKEVHSVYEGICLISLELAARFLTDYFEDTYFGWDANRYPNRQAHNLARCRGQIALYRDVVKKRGELCKLIGC